MARHGWILTLAAVLLIGGFLAAPIPVPAEGGAEAPADDSTPPIPTKQVAPVYPEGAREAGAEGMVIVKLTISETGRPVKAGIRESSGREDLDAAATDAVRQWIFEPGTKDGRPVESEVAIPIRFALDGDGDGGGKVKVKKPKAKTK